jgi:membrane-bound lytic murein transglycosylase D
MKMCKISLCIYAGLLCLALCGDVSAAEEVRFDEYEIQTSLTDKAICNTLRGISDSTYDDRALKAIRKNVTLFSETIKERFSVYLSRSGKYLDLMREILKENDIPEEIVFLPLIESGFNPHAYSRARAAGYWQFIASTAKKYGLTISWWKDERRDPVKSTVAAANYLKDLYGIFGSWNLAMAAYNAGEGKIMRALRKTKSDDYWSLLRTNYIKKETKNYVPKFVAASTIAHNPGDFGFNDVEYHSPLDYDTVTLNAPVDLDVAAKCAETSVEVIRDLNPELRRWCTPADVYEYELRIPPGSKSAFTENLSTIPEEERFSMDRYTVRTGDTFWRIARRTGVPLQAILDLNNLEKIIPLRAGAEIYIPPKGKVFLDKEDRAAVKKASYKYQYKKKKQKPKQKKI